MTTNCNESNCNGLLEKRGNGMTCSKCGKRFSLHY